MPKKKDEQTFQMDTALLEEAAMLYRAVNNTVRRQILTFLHREKKTAVTPIYKTLKLEQSVTSQQLAILRDAGVVLAEREGKHVFYSVNYDRLAALHRAAAAILQAKAI